MARKSSRSDGSAAPAASDSELGEALGQAYVAKYFPPAEKQRTLEMTLAIEQAMDKDIDGLDWMSAADQGEGQVKSCTR
jgi:putative endopeptidase